MQSTEPQGLPSPEQTKLDHEDALVLRAIKKFLEEMQAHRPETMGQLLLELPAGKQDENRVGGDCYKKGTTERYAWHAGQFSALSDVLRIIKNRAMVYCGPDSQGRDIFLPIPLGDTDGDPC